MGLEFSIDEDDELDNNENEYLVDESESEVDYDNDDVDNINTDMYSNLNTEKSLTDIFDNDGSLFTSVQLGLALGLAEELAQDQEDRYRHIDTLSKRSIKARQLDLVSIKKEDRPTRKFEAYVNNLLNH